MFNLNTFYRLNIDTINNKVLSLVTSTCNDLVFIWDVDCIFFFICPLVSERLLTADKHKIAVMLLLMLARRSDDKRRHTYELQICEMP
jgi:hypothetical protein